MTREFFFTQAGNVLLQLFDRKVVDKDKMQEILHMEFKTGAMDEKYWSKMEELHIANFLMQLFDRGLISGEVLLAKIFGESE